MITASSDRIQRFTGPLFIVGMSRSGTKLLRDLLNRHPDISLPISGSHFIPHFVKKYGDSPDFEQADSLEAFYDHELQQTPLFWHMKQIGKEIPKEDFLRSVDGKSWSSIFEYILRYFAPVACLDKPDIIWGEKCPKYLSQMQLLKKLYPSAKFLHIIRDPRDRSLSMKKTWGKSLYRAAYRWKDSIETARDFGKTIPRDYLEVQYEQLLAKPETVLKMICSFLEIRYAEEMKRLERPSEYHGDARHRTDIADKNFNKFHAELSPRQIRRIEEIVFPVIKTMDYRLAGC